MIKYSISRTVCVCVCVSPEGRGLVPSWEGGLGLQQPVVLSLRVPGAIVSRAQRPEGRAAPAIHSTSPGQAPDLGGPFFPFLYQSCSCTVLRGSGYMGL